MAGSVDPVRDLSIIMRELLLKDIAMVKTYLSKNRRNVERNVGGKDAKAEFDVMEKVYCFLRYPSGESGPAAAGGGGEAAGGGGGGATAAPAKPEDEDLEDIGAEAELGREIRMGTWDGKEIEVLNKFQLLTAKPAVFLANLSEKQYTTRKCKWLGPLKEFIDGRKQGEKLIPFSASFEEKYLNASETSKEEADKLGEEAGVSTMLPKIIHAGYRALRLIHFFTAGGDEVKAWTIRKGTHAPKAAGTIHTDFEKGFIAADTMAFDDLKELGTETEVKKCGKLRTEGKAYEVKDGDIMHFKFNT